MDLKKASEGLRSGGDALWDRNGKFGEVGHSVRAAPGTKKGEREGSQGDVYSA